MRELLASANPMTRKLLASESPEKLVKTQIAAPSPRGSGAVCLEWVLRLCISGRLPADADAICSRDQTLTTIALVQSHRFTGSVKLDGRSKSQSKLKLARTRNSGAFEAKFFKSLFKLELVRNFSFYSLWRKDLLSKFTEEIGL